MELIGIPACAPADDIPIQTSQFFLLIIHACSGPIDKSVCILCDPGIFLIKSDHVLDHRPLLTFSWIENYKAGPC